MAGHFNSQELTLKQKVLDQTFKHWFAQSNITITQQNVCMLGGLKCVYMIVVMHS